MSELEALERALAGASAIPRTSSNGRWIWTDEEMHVLKDVFITSYMSRWLEIRKAMQ